MEIIPYSELPDKHWLLPLFFHAGHTPLDYRRFEQRRESDFRFREGPGGFCAVEDGQLLGFAGLMQMPTQTLERPRTVGGVWAVATHASHTRRGVGTALMETAHRYFRERGFPFAFLTTSRSWTAHDWYRKLGYIEVDVVNSLPMAYRLVESSDEPSASSEGLHPPAEDGVAQLFSEFTAGLTGFTIRPKEFLGFNIERKQIDNELSIEREDGYALVGEWMGTVVIREMVTRHSQAQELLLQALERRGAGAIVDPLVATDALLDGYRARGYHEHRGRYYVVMAKALEQDITFQEVYGSRFYMSSLQWF